MPVLWYGSSTTEPDDPVAVQPIHCRKYHQQGRLGVSKRGLHRTSSSSSSFSLSASSTIPNLVPQIVLRKTLSTDVEKFYDEFDSPLTVAFISALAAFDDWDNGSIHNYIWPLFIAELIR
jgi:hypothetical protein